ncbi:hypothetical protein ACIG0D_01700 [Streptomyces sp. NPDC052773]|uniref:hypothetical protein n=1 Tax=Streptomyces sp. NPDC052773 TaxID=3365693 RepID=UPI0037D94F6F
MRTRTTTVAALAAALLTLTACSSSGEDAAPATDSGTPSPEPTVSVPAEHEADDLEAAVAVYTSAYFAGDADTAYGMLSERCQGKIGPEAYSAVVEQAKADYGPDHPATDVQAEVSGKLARVSYKVKGLPKFDQQAQPWTLEGDAWKYDAC